MSTLTTTARGHATVEPRLQAGTVVVKVGDAVLSLDIAEALQIGQLLLAAAGQTGNTLTALADHGKQAIVIGVDGLPLLELSPAAWTALSMLGSSAALELQGPTLRVGLRSARLQRGNSDLVEVTA